MDQVIRGEAVAASPAGALPVVTFGVDLTFHLNGDDVRVVHVEQAHTDGDALVFWTRANVLHMGGVYFNGMLPFIDLESGGSIAGLRSAVGEALAMTNDSTVIIPGHGPVARRADLIAYRDMLADVHGQIFAAMEQGRGLDQIKAMRPAGRYGRDTDFIAPDAFVEAVYRSLREEVAPHSH
jgi:glyoxylase-like metal-dependent hydrolase (beta-lactamase superfamily II)